MKFVKLLVLLSFYLASCTRCVTTTPIPPEDDSLTLEPSSDEPFAIKFTNRDTAVKINPAKFPGCVGYKITFKSVYYGLFLADQIIFLPLPAEGEKAKLEITCTTNDSKPGATRSWNITRLN